MSRSNEIRTWMQAICEADDPLFFAVIEVATGKATGVAALMRIKPETGVIEVGSITYSPKLQTESKLKDSLTKMLSGFVKICAECKMIHHKEAWMSIERYAAEQMDYHDFSHGLCDPCARKLYDDEDLGL